MKLLILRHGRAERVKDFGALGKDDSLRPLTEEGRERLRLAVAGLHRLVRNIDVLATSPFLRTRQSADIVAVEYGLTQVVELKQLQPGTAPEVLTEWLTDAGARETIAVVGHHMQLRHLAGWLLTGRAKPLLHIRKGGAVLLDLRTTAQRGPGRRRARLLWSLTPRQLRMLGRTASGPETVTDV
jgi:phosphohistidine phosphatase